MTVVINKREVLDFNRTLKPLLIEEIRQYQIQYGNETETEQILGFLATADNLFGRDSVTGHITCGAWILDPTLTKVILVRHRRLDRWIQPGGHIEPLETPFAGALREAVEETGIEQLIPWKEELFNLSVHLFPEGKDGSAHFHYDFRYLFFAPSDSELRAADETDGVAWVSLEQIQAYTDEATILGMAAKTRQLIDQGMLSYPKDGPGE